MRIAFFDASATSTIANLREDVVVAMRQPHARQCAENAHGHNQNDRERQGKASYNAARTRNTSKTLIGKIHGLSCQPRPAGKLSQSTQISLLGQDSRNDFLGSLASPHLRSNQRRSTIDISSRVTVVAHHHIGTVRRGDSDERRKGIISPLPARLKLQDILSIAPVA